MSRGNTLAEQRMAKWAKRTEPSASIIKKVQLHALHCRPPRMLHTSTTIDEMGLGGPPVLTCRVCTIDTAQIEMVRTWSMKNASQNY